ncbi:hypothetical protein V8F33_010998 [Rhypophila sp. PSN 637]
MLLPRDIMMERSELGTRQSQAPCPQGNGTTVGADQEYTLLCNLLVDGDVMDRPDAFDFAACLNLCSSFHPKCEAISYNENRCLLKNNLQLGNSRTARRFDSAVARFPGASSNCPTVGATQLIGGNTTFGIMCGNIVAGFDMAQNFAPTFQDCMGQCAFTAGCGGVSFDASQDQGFKNCYMKTTVTNSSAIFPNQNIDSALIANLAAADPAASPTTAPPAAVPTTAGPGVATIPLSQVTTAGGGGAGGAVFFTPPGETVGVPIPISSAASVNPADTVVAPPDSTLDPDISGELPQSDSALPPGADVPFTQGLTQSGGSTIATAAPDSALDNSPPGDSGSSNAWIAAPVVGSIAALVLIVLSFIMIKRRRRNNGFDSPLNGKTPIISRPSPVSSLFTTWLPSSLPLPTIGGRNSRARASRGSGQSQNQKMGNFSQVVGAQDQMSGGAGMGLSSKLGMRGSVVGFFRPGGSTMSGMERLDDIEEMGGKKKRPGSTNSSLVSDDDNVDMPVYNPNAKEKEAKLELRNSLNGLGQNRWS